MSEEFPINLHPKAHLFLTSLPGSYYIKGGKMETDGFYPTNEFINNFSKLWKNISKILFITAAPENCKFSQFIIDVISLSFKIANLSYKEFDLCDNENYNQKLEEYQVIILGGGHIQTQNKFFEKIKLKGRIRDFEGKIIVLVQGQ